MLGTVIAGSKHKAKQLTKCANVVHNIGHQRTRLFTHKADKHFNRQRKGQFIRNTSSTTLKTARQTSRRYTTAMSAALEVYVKAKPGTDAKVLGDCPFSQRILVTLEEKGIPHNRFLIDFDDKPAWFLEKNPEGKVPVIHHDGKWVADSDLIVEYLDEKFPEPAITATEEQKKVGSGVFGAFVKYFRGTDDEETKKALLDELEALNSILASKGPYIGGSDICATDLALAPKLRHMKVACEHFKPFKVPEEYTALQEYIKNMLSRDSFQKTFYPDEYILEGWEPKLPKL